VPGNQSYKRKNRFREAIFIQTPQTPLSAKTASLFLKNICLFFHLTSVSILTNSKTFVKSRENSQFPMSQIQNRIQTQSSKLKTQK